MTDADTPRPIDPALKVVFPTFHAKTEYLCELALWQHARGDAAARQTAASALRNLILHAGGHIARLRARYEPQMREIATPGGRT